MDNVNYYEEIRMALERIRGTIAEYDRGAFSGMPLSLSPSREATTFNEAIAHLGKGFRDGDEEAWIRAKELGYWWTKGGWGYLDSCTYDPSDIEGSWSRLIEAITYDAGYLYPMTEVDE